MARFCQLPLGEPLQVVMGDFMANDISVVVGDGSRRMTYAELAAVRGISRASAKRLSQRHHWGRQLGNDGVVRVTVPLLALVPPTRRKDDAGDVTPGVIPATAPLTAKTKRKSVTGDSDLVSPIGGATDPDVTDDVIGDVALMTETLSQAVETLREQLERERKRSVHAEAWAERAERRIDELLHDLADARHAALSSGSEAAALRTQLAMMMERRPWWRRWFR